MATYEAAILDVDGTIVRGDELVPGATGGLRALEAAGLSRLLFSNNPTRGPSHYRDTLAVHGLEIEPGAVLTSATVTAEFLAANHGDDSVYLVGSDRLAAILEAEGIERTADPLAADAVLGSIDRSFTYDRLRDALRALERDVPFYGTDPDATIPTDEGPVPGSGAILASLSAVAGRDPDAILGKPSGVAAAAALTRLEAAPERTLVVGDRLDTDVALGNRAGMTTAVVRTGITDDRDLETLEDDDERRPDFVLDSLADIDTVLDSGP